MNYVKVFVGAYIVWNGFWVAMMILWGWGTFWEILIFLSRDTTILIIDLVLCGCVTYIYSFKDMVITIKR